MKLRSLCVSTLVGTLLAGVSVLSASAADCTAGTVTAGGVGYSQCIGSFDGNDTGSSNALFTELSKGVFDDITEWEFVGKSDEGAFDALGGTAGSWSFSDAFTTGPFVLSLKASNSWSAYFFENTDGALISEGTWETIGVSTNKQGKAQALSHATIYRASGSYAGADDPQDVPEPTSSAALGIMFLGTFGVLKKKNM